MQLGLGVAVESCLSLGQDAIWGRIQALAALMRSGLARLKGVQVQDVGATLCGIVSFTKVRGRARAGCQPGSRAAEVGGWKVEDGASYFLEREGLY